MAFRFILIFLFIIPFFCVQTNGQQFFRIKADFSIKEELPNDSFQLIMGKVYYDDNYQKIIYNLEFPSQEKWIFEDTTITRVVNGQAYPSRIPQLIKFSIFHNALNNQLRNFGLDGTVYEITSVKKEKDLVIMEWRPKNIMLRKNLGKIVMSRKGNELYGVAFFNKDETLLSRQFFLNYGTFDGLKFPQKVIHEIILEDKKLYRIFTYENIVVNDISEDHSYNYSGSH